MATRIEQLADAFLHVATVNHYMVGIVEVYTPDELDGAEQLLITRSNSDNNENPDLELALDLIEHARLVNFIRVEQRKGKYVGPACELCGEPAGEGGAMCPACKESR